MTKEAVEKRETVLERRRKKVCVTKASWSSTWGTRTRGGTERDF
jgi:hypothetical protein